VNWFFVSDVVSLVIRDTVVFLVYCMS
jgi:hypothetical protein